MRRQSLCAITLVVAATMTVSTAQAQSAQSGDHYNPQTAGLNFSGSKSNQKTSRAGFRLMPEGTYSNARHSRFSLTATSNPVTGSGTAGRIAKWSGVFGTNTFVLGNSSITEDKFGKVGIGTMNPTSPLTVAGLIETISPGGGIKFADGTIQTTSATGALFSIPHDGTLTGNGTAGSPLGVAVPLNLSGNISGFIISVTNTGGGDGVISRGSNRNTLEGGRGVLALGGNSISGIGGIGVAASGGDSDSSVGGSGIFTNGGNSNGGPGGLGIAAEGGDSTSGFGGNGVDARGGDSDSSNGGDGVRAEGGNSTSGLGGDGLFAIGGVGPLGNGLAGDFNGNVDVSGMLSKGGGSFKIDHPLDPENKYLYHSFVESPDMKNIYDGVVTLDSNGEAIIELPKWFQALNRDFRYLLTPIGAPMPGLFVAQKVRENRFKIAGGQPGMEVSWQVTGIRQDGWANRNRIKVEVEKTERERGYYLHPEAFDQPEELGVQYLKHPEMMQQRKEARERAKQKQQ